MLTEIDTLRLIFGLKIQYLRRESGLSYQQLSELTGLAISYLHDIEKGKKYPKADKIMLLAKALGTDYNYLVSLDAGKKLKPIIDLLHSDFLKLFPLELFGINMPKLVELISDTPDRVNAFISTIIKIIRNYQLRGEDFYKAALRSYQDIHDNYFETIEQEVNEFKAANQLSLVTTRQLERLLLSNFGIHTNRQLLPDQSGLEAVRSYYLPEQKTLYLNQGLSQAQENFLLAKEIGFQCLNLKERPYETRMLEVGSFDKLLNNFRASYFSVALLMDEVAVVEEVEKMAAWEKWDAELFLGLMTKYTLTAEMLLQRLANILPRHFGIKDLFFLRFFTDAAEQKFEMTKEMHLSQLHNPHANHLDEHYCRRWISISLIRKMKALNSLENTSTELAGAQISRYWGTSNAYLCLSIAKPAHHEHDNSTSVTIGLLVNDKLKQLFRFMEAPDLPVRDVHTTCERCPIPDCEARAASPVALQRLNAKDRIKSELERIKEMVNKDLMV